MTAMSKVHTPVPPGHPQYSLFDAPLLCGRARTYETKVSYSPEKVTCAKCLKLLARHDEEVEYQRVKERRAREIEQAHP
jgi:hypothetical protein